LQCSSDDHAQPLRVYAAASLTTLMPQLADAYKRQHERVSFQFNFAASSLLAKQIEHGVQADLFLSANPQWMDYLQQKQLLRPGTRINLLNNRLVLIALAENTTISSLTQLSEAAVSKIALADWSHVPAGIYAKAALQKAHLWEQVKQKCVPALDVRAALTYVARDEVDCGIVYRTDAALSEKVRIVAELPQELQPEINYPVAILRSSTHVQSATFLHFLTSDTAGQIMRDNGFTLSEGVSVTHD